MWRPGGEGNLEHCPSTLSVAGERRLAGLEKAYALFYTSTVWDFDPNPNSYLGEQPELGVKSLGLTQICSCSQMVPR